MPPRAAVPPARDPAQWQAGARGDGRGGRPVPASPPPRARARRAPRWSSPRELLRGRPIHARRRRLPDRPADAPVGGGRGAAGRCTCARRRATCARPATSTASRSPTRASRSRGRALGARSARRGTLVIADEAHHLGEELAWGEGFHLAFGRRSAGCCCRARRSAPTSAPIPGVRYDDGVAMPDVVLQLRRRGPRPHLPAGHVHPLRRACCSGAAARSSSRRRSTTRSPAARRARRYRTAISIDLADGLPRILGQAHERLERGPRRRPPRRRRASSSPPTASTRARSPRCCARSPACAPTVVLHTDARAAREARGVPRSTRPLDRRGEHGQRGRRHPAPARRRLRHGRQDAADLPPDRRPLRAHDPGPPGWT